MKIPSAVLTLLLTACSAQRDWSYDAITTGSPLFDSARLTHSPLTGYPPWKIEILKSQEETEIFVSLVQYQLHPLADDPFKVKISLSIQDESNSTVRSLEDTVPLFEGRMRLRFSNSLAQEFIQSLQEGKKVSILIDGLEETIEPDLFKKKFFKVRWHQLQLVKHSKSS